MTTVERINEVLRYDPVNGGFVWRLSLTSRAREGQRAGTASGSAGYRRLRLDGVTHLEHRLVFFYHHGRWPQPQCDHIDGDRANNRIENLREVSVAQNAQNRRGHNKSTGVKGVYRSTSGKPFYSQIKVNGRNKSLGSFNTVEEASLAFQQAEAALKGEYAPLRQ